MDKITRDKVYEHYQLGQGSIQDIARVYKLEVEEVLEVIGQMEVTTIDDVGDLVDSSELDPGTQVNTSKKHRAKYTTN